MITSGRGLGGVEAATGHGGLLEQAMSMSAVSNADENSEAKASSSMLGATGTGMGESARPSESITADGLGETLLDDDELGLGSDLDEDQGEDEDVEPTKGMNQEERRKSMLLASQRSSYMTDHPPLQFQHEPIPARNADPNTEATAPVSALTAALHKHVPHLVSSNTDEPQEDTVSNPFASLYASVSAQPPQPSLELSLYFPHSAKPTMPLQIVVRKEATVEEVTGYGLYKYWEEAREPLLSLEDGDEQRWSTVGWGLRIVEDDGEVDEDFPR